MATVVQPLIEPDCDTIHAHLTALFEPCAEYYPDGLVELRFGAGFTTAYFTAKPDGIDQAAAFAASRNRQGDNVYVGVNPRKPATKRPGQEGDVAIAFWHFADLDKAEAVEQAGRRMKALPPTMTVTTGTEPNRRPHLYWKLDYPTGDMAAWTSQQRGLMNAFGGDPVIDPPRIMRLAGTVNYPTQDKVGRGYRMELTSLRTKFNEDRPPVSADEIGAAYPFVPEQRESAQPLPGQNTLQAMSPTGKTQALIAAALSDDHWHNNVRDLVARLARLGRTDDEIMLMASGLTRAGYSLADTEKEMWAALQSARAKYNIPAPVDDGPADEALDADEIFEILDLDAIEEIPPPTYLIDNFLPDDGLSIIYGDPGAGKSFIALDIALRLAHGMDWHGVTAKPIGVLYVAGEAQKGVANRIKGWRRQHDLMDVHAPFVLLPIAVQLLDPKQRQKLLRTIDAAVKMAGFPIGLVIIDTVSRALAGADENGQDSMGMFVSACDDTKRYIGGALLGVHHTGKDKEKGMRGSSVLLGACDAIFKVTKDEDDLATIENEKQKDAEEAAQIYLKLAEFVWSNGALGKELKTLVPTKSEAPLLVKDTLSNEQIGTAFGILADAWAAGRPLSTSPNTRDQGRYAPSVLSNRLGAPEVVIKTFLVSWLETNCLAIEETDSHSKSKGIRVLKPIVRNG